MASPRHGVLLVKTPTSKTGRELLAEIHQPGAVGHGRGDGHNLGVLPGQAHQGFAKDLGVARDLADALFGLTGIGIKLAQAVKAGGVGLGRYVTLALGGEHMNQDRPFQVFDIVESLDEMVQTVPVHRPQVGEFEGLEEHARGEKGLKGLFAPLGPGHQILADGRQGAQQVLHLLFQEDHGGPGELAADKG
jgi:hypothetical protein